MEDHPSIPEYDELDLPSANAAAVNYFIYWYDPHVDDDYNEYLMGILRYKGFDV